MGMMERVFALLFGSGRNVVKDTVEVFRENAEAGAERSHDIQSAAMRAYAREFEVARQGGG